jgi:hypothetical protein
MPFWNQKSKTTSGASEAIADASRGDGRRAELGPPPRGAPITLTMPHPVGTDPQQFEELPPQTTETHHTPCGKPISGTLHAVGGQRQLLSHDRVGKRRRRYRVRQMLFRTTSCVNRRRRTHSITSSARASNMGGISRPRTLAALRLITNSNLVGCTIGISAGFAPLRMRPAYMPACRYKSVLLGP